jgi:hypothetical protein
MTQRELQFLQSEVATLEALLGNLPQERVIERIGLESRLAEAREHLSQVLHQPRARSLPITFRGNPVEGSRSFDAGFASEALKAFVEATDTVAASLSTDDLKDRGRLPGAGERSLRIVDTALGSFGFELELPPLPEVDGRDQQNLFDLLPDKNQADPYADAIATTFSLIEQAASMDEGAITDLLTEIHPRAAGKVRAFAKVLYDHQALFAAEFESKRVSINSREEVQHIIDFLDDANISETLQVLSATVQGILPESRIFEARLDDGTVVKGKVDRTLPDIMVFKSQVENTSTLLRFRVVNVRASRRYVLMGYPEEDAP